MAARHTRGFSLPELLVALTLGLLLMAAFIAVLDHCRREMTANESLAQLDDAARRAVDALVLDLEHAGFFGLQGASGRQLVRGGSVVAAADALRQPGQEHPESPVEGLPPGSHACGVNFAVDLELAVQGSNHSWPAGVEADGCDPAVIAGGIRPGSDSLTVRHASRERVSPHAGRLQLYSRQREAHVPVSLFADGQAPGPLDADAEVRDLEVRSYYVANNSVGHPGWPALRVKALTESGGAAQFRDEEVMPGVEDLQVEFGVRDTGGSGSIRFVTADFSGLRAQRVVAVRFWLRLCAEITERDYQDTRELRYADVDFVPDADQATQRRLLVERTVALRNAMIP